MIYTLHKNTMKTCAGGVEQVVSYLNQCFKDEMQELTFQDNWQDKVTPDSVWIVDSCFCPPDIIYSSKAVITIAHGLSAYLDTLNGHQLSQFSIQQRDFFKSIPEANKTPDIKSKILCVSVSEGCTNSLKRFCNIDADATIINPVDTDRFVPKEKPKPARFANKIYITDEYKQELELLGFIGDGRGKHIFDKTVISGRWHAHKGGKYIEAIKSHLDPNRYVFKELVDINPDDRCAYYQQSDIYLNISTFEGCSMVLNEALACNLPIVSTDCGLFEGTDYHNKYEIGMVFPVKKLQTDDPKFVARYIEVINSELLNNYQYESRQFALEHLSLPVWKEQWLGFFKKYDLI